MTESGHLLHSETTSTPRLSEKKRIRVYSEAEKLRRSKKAAINYQEKLKGRRLEQLYGITLQQRDELFEAQGFVCAICSAADPGSRDWHVDHCHETQAVRGVLCHHCNTGLGLFKDNPDTLAKAITYLGK